jgi:hypothetical protein
LTQNLQEKKINILGLAVKDRLIKLTKMVQKSSVVSKNYVFEWCKACLARNFCRLNNLYFAAVSICLFIHRKLAHIATLSFAYHPPFFSPVLILHKQFTTRTGALWKFLCACDKASRNSLRKLSNCAPHAAAQG